VWDIGIEQRKKEIRQLVQDKTYEYGGEESGISSCFLTLID
jgi:hypothetical protein